MVAIPRVYSVGGSGSDSAAVEEPRREYIQQLKLLVYMVKMAFEIRQDRAGELIDQYRTTGLQSAPGLPHDFFA